MRDNVQNGQVAVAEARMHDRPNWVFYRRKPLLVRVLRTRIPMWIVKVAGALAAATAILMYIKALTH